MSAIVTTTSSVLKENGRGGSLKFLDSLFLMVESSRSLVWRSKHVVGRDKRIYRQAVWRLTFQREVGKSTDQALVSLSSVGFDNARNSKVRYFKTTNIKRLIDSPCAEELVVDGRPVRP